MSEIVIYADHMSQPSRAVLAFCHITKVPFRLVEIRVLRGEVLTEEFAKISPSQTVPTLVHGSLVLYESNSILTYLADLVQVPDHWYPSDPKYRSLVNNYLHWHHLNVRYGCGFFLFNRYAAPKLYGKSSEELEIFTNECRENAFEIIEKNLKKTGFVAGTQEVSIADLACYCEVLAMRWANLSFEKWPEMEKWMGKIGEIPEVKAAHTVFEKLSPRVKL